MPRHERTASEVVMKAMEEFREAEPKLVFIIHTDEAGQIVFRSNANIAEILGMIEYAKQRLISQNFYKEKREHD